MAISKKYLKSKPVCKVTFELKEKAEKVELVGSFSNWKSTPLKKFKNGKFKATLDLEKGSTYEFRYVVDGIYVNDSQADDYVWNEYAGAENGVLSL